MDNPLVFVEKKRENCVTNTQKKLKLIEQRLLLEENIKQAEK